MRVPAALAARVEEVCGLTDAICAQHLDAEYALLCRQLVAKLSRRRPSPLTKGEARTWAAGVLHAVGTVNFLFDREQRLHLTPEELSRHTGVAKSTTAAKSRLIQGLLG
ncbi:MAG: DUF6398 domain-containing protein, partial [Gemmatimonadales bacterium]|nr:DUF6398 domain-containing protein [Gemmatimonadales bacterium]